MRNKQTHLYEGMYIINATLSDEARQKAVEKIKSGITERGGEIHKIVEMGRRKLAYEIDGRREGFYYLIFFSVETGHMNEMWREYHLNEDLIRFMTQTIENLPEGDFKPRQLIEMA